GVKMLKVENLSKTFSMSKKEKNTPLRNASFDIFEREIVGIVGKSGEGKSTIARILCGVLEKDSGEIMLNGESLFDEKGKYNRKIGLAIQLVSQSPLLSLDPLQTVGDGIVEIIKKHNKTWTRKECEEITLQLLDKVWLESNIVKRLPSEISSGQSQRIAIARALAVQPKLLIADESTANLDVKSQAQVIEIYRELKRSENMSILFISHDLELVNAVTDRIYVLENGELKLKEKNS
ncbi:MAG: dipeptide/oligopeptide/nickel ABC transporter ATP-binding protein, partial [Clostridia bacterium]